MNGAKQYKVEPHGGRTVEFVAVSCELPGIGGGLSCWFCVLEGLFLVVSSGGAWAV